MGKKKKKTIHVAPPKQVDPLIDAIICTKAAMECDNRPTTAGSCLKQASKDEFISPFTGSISTLNEENKDEVAKVSKLENYFKEPMNVESEEENKVEEKKEEKKQEVKSVSLLQKFMKLFGW